MSTSPPPLAGDPVIDRIVAGLVALTELLVPGRVKAYYLSGSYAIGNARPESDLDLLVILPTDAVPKHVAGLEATYAECGKLTPMALDVTVCTEAEVRALGRGWFRGRHRLIRGVDLLADLPPSPPADEAGRWVNSAVGILRNLSRDPADPYLGFTAWPVRRRDGQEEPGTRALAVSSYWVANAMLARRGVETGVYKDAELAGRFRNEFGDEWY